MARVTVEELPIEDGAIADSEKSESVVDAEAAAKERIYQRMIRDAEDAKYSGAFPMFQHFEEEASRIDAEKAAERAEANRRRRNQAKNERQRVKKMLRSSQGEDTVYKVLGGNTIDAEDFESGAGKGHASMSRAAKGGRKAKETKRVEHREAHLKGVRKGEYEGSPRDVRKKSKKARYEYKF